MPFSEFLGNPRCVEILRQALQRDRVPHALLFAGPDAVGKRLLAGHLARALNCAESGGADWCGHCAQCRLIDLGHHADVRFVEPDGQQIKIEQVRQVIHEAVRRPFQGRCRVFVLDPAERLTLPAANALLRILEEPPTTARLILLTTQPHALLPTIRSRCQVLRFAALGEAEIAQILRQQFDLPAAEAGQRARLAEGSVGRAVGLDLKHYEALGQSVETFLRLSIEAQPLGDAAALITQVAKEREETEEWLRRLLAAFRGRLHAVVNGSAGASGPTFPQLEAMVHACEEVRRGLTYNVNRTLALENLFLRCVEIRKRVS